MSAPRFLPFALTAQQRRSGAILFLLMLVGAFTEGFGLLLLVPMLDALGTSTEGSGAADSVSRFVAGLGIPITLEGLLLAFVGLIALRAIAAYARAFQAHRLEVSLVDGLRTRAWSALLHSDWRYLSSLRQAESSALIITDIDRIGFGLNQALSASTTGVTLVGVGLAAFAISPVLALAALATGALVLFAYRHIRRRAAAVGEELSQAYGDIYIRLGEGLGALRVIKSFGREERTARETGESFARLRQAQLRFLRDSNMAQMALQVGGAIALAALVWLAIARWGAGVAQILPLVALFARALPLLGTLQRTWQQWEHARPAVVRTRTLIADAEAHREAPDESESPAPRLRDTLVLEDVHVAFEGREAPALEGVSLELAALSVTALVGPSGAGKSTLADVVGGLVTPDRGYLAVDGTRIDAGRRKAWRRRVTYVQQEPVLFSGSIRDNMLWLDPDASTERIEMVLDMASAHFVRDLPNGLETIIGDHGRALSGGERQRIVLARALLRDPDLLILDEAASALDAENEAAIVAAVQRIRKRVTIVIIGHRGALTACADRTLRLERGRLVSGG